MSSTLVENVISPPNCPKKRSKEIVQYTPPFSNMLVILNKRSGGWQAVGLERTFCRLAGRTNVLDITEVNDVAHLKEQLKHLSGRKDVKVIAGCGDGTISSVFSLLDLLEISAPLAPLALGTGNELSGVTGWGRAYVGESIEDFMDNVDNGRVTPLDRWSVTFKKTPRRGSQDLVLNSNGASLEHTENMLCFFSLGFDAEIALKFHYLRESNPSLCANRELNKLYHTIWGAKMLVWGANPVAHYLELYVDGKKIDLPSTLGCLQIFNIHSSGSGVDYFGLRQKSNSYDLLHDYSQPSMGDGLLEIIGTEDILHYLQISAYTHGRRIAQGSHIRIKILGNRPLPVQMDGNPWEQEPCEIIISRKDQLKMVLGNRPEEYRGI